MASKTEIPTPSAPRRVGRTHADFRALHDKDFIIPAKIRAAITALGPEGWEYDGPFTKLAGVSQTDMAAFRDNFLLFQAIARPTKASGNPAVKIVWCGSVAFARKLGGPRTTTE